VVVFLNNGDPPLLAAAIHHRKVRFVSVPALLAEGAILCYKPSVSASHEHSPAIAASGFCHRWNEFRPIAYTQGFGSNRGCNFPEPISRNPLCQLIRGAECQYELGSCRPHLAFSKSLIASSDVLIHGVRLRNNGQDVIMVLLHVVLWFGSRNRLPLHVARRIGANSL
jgi:hypothetical protein